MRGIEDIGRIVQKFVTGRGGVTDLQAIRTASQLWSRIFRRIAQERHCESKPPHNPTFLKEWESMDVLLSRTADLQHLIRYIESAIEDVTDTSLPLPPDGEGLSTGEGDINEGPAPISGGVNTLWRSNSARWTIKPGQVTWFSAHVCIIYENSQILIEAHQYASRACRIAQEKGKP
jgi:hypothetical protein